MAKKPKKPLSRGPKGGKKHTPGRDHDRKTRAKKRKKFQKRAQQLKARERAEAERQWQVWDSLSTEQKHFRRDLEPTHPRPSDDD